MKILYWIVGVVLGLPLLGFAAMYAASEAGGEVATLHRPLAQGGVSEVRVWVVDQGSDAFIEHGDESAYWFVGLADSAQLVVQRNGQTNTYLAMPDPDAHELYHQLRRDKYGWADQVVAVFAPDTTACPGIPVRLTSLN